MIKDGFKKATDFISYSDADGDAASKYKLWDSEGGNNWWLANVGQDGNGTGKYIDASSGYEISASDYARLYLRADSKNLTSNLYIQPHDGEVWGNWQSFKLTSQMPNTKPVVTVADQTCLLYTSDAADEV